MNDLTEQWKKGELPEGDYYIKRRNGDTLYDNIDSHGVWRNSIDEDIVEVLAEVPSYEEWQASENYIDYLKQCISVYESKDKQATETSIAYNELLEENAQLKGLLKLNNVLNKGSKSIYAWLKQDTAGEQKKLCADMFDKTVEMMSEINQALGED